MNPRILFFLSTFPKVSEAFILTEICGLLDLGYDIRILSRNRSIDNIHHGQFQKYGLAERLTVVPRMHPIGPIKYVQGLFLVFRNWKHPSIIISSLNVFRFGRKALNLSLLFLASGALRVKNWRDISIVHCHFGENLFYVNDLLKIKALQGKVITTFHGRDVNSYLKSGRELFYSRVQHLPSAIIVNSSFLADKLAALHFDSSRINILPVPVSPNFLSSVNNEIQHNKSISLMSVGRLNEEKGFDTLLEALHILVREMKLLNVHLVVVGDGPLLEKLKEYAKRESLSNHITFLGSQSQEELKEHYSNSDIFILCSRPTGDSEETQALVLQEAQTMGLPVVASRIGGIPEGMVEGKTGFLCRHDNANDFAEKVKLLIEDPQRRKLMGEEARNFASEKYGVLKHCRELATIYQAAEL